MGSRYGGLKQIDNLGPGGEALMEYAIFDAKQAGFQRVVIVTRPEIAPLIKTKLVNAEKEVELVYAYQRMRRGHRKPPGTAHALLSAREQLGSDPFVLLNADDFYGCRAMTHMADFLRSKPPENSGAMLGYRLEETLSAHGSVSRGICEVNAQSELLHIAERKEIYREGEQIVCRLEEGKIARLSKDAIVSMNIWCFHPAIFPELERGFSSFLRKARREAEYHLPLFVNELLKRDRLRISVLPEGGEWLGVTYRSDRKRVRSALLRKAHESIYPHPLFTHF